MAFGAKTIAFSLPPVEREREREIAVQTEEQELSWRASAISFLQFQSIAGPYVLTLLQISCEFVVNCLCFSIGRASLWKLYWMRGFKVYIFCLKGIRGGRVFVDKSFLGFYEIWQFFERWWRLLRCGISRFTQKSVLLALWSPSWGTESIVVCFSFFLYGTVLPNAFPYCSFFGFLGGVVFWFIVALNPRETRNFVLLYYTFIKHCHKDLNFPWIFAACLEFGFLWIVYVNWVNAW